MSLIATQNPTATDTDQLTLSDLLDSLTLHTWVGQSASQTIRFAIESEYGSVSLTCPDDRVSFSLDSVHYAESVDYRQTVWTLVRHDQEYHLQNVNQQTYFRGSFLYFYSELVRVQYPAAGSRESYLPWSIIYDAESKPIDYVRSFAVGHAGEVDCSEYL